MSEPTQQTTALQIGPEPLNGEAARTCLAAYYAELQERFDGGFDPNRGGSAGRSAAKAADAVAGSFLVARLGDRLAGCGLVRTIAPGIGEIKRMWVAPEMRGRGVARQLLAAMEQHARDLGLSVMRLDTNRSLAEAQSLYRRAGYHEIAPYNDNPTPISGSRSGSTAAAAERQPPGQSSPISR